MAYKNRLSLISKKCKYMLFYMPQQNIQAPQIVMNDTDLELWT